MTDKIQNDLNKLTKSELIELLATTKKYSEMIEAKIAEQDEFKFNYNPRTAWYVGSHNNKRPFASKGVNIELENSVLNGVYRLDNMKALKASDNIFNNNIVDAISEQIEPNWEPDFDDLKQEKCWIAFDPNKNVYTVFVSYTEVPVGIAIMSLGTAHTIKRMLNEGKVKLYFEGKR